CWTLNALFSGKRELFEGLAIAKTDWEWESFPVIHLDMSKVSTDEGSAGVRRSLAFHMKRAADEHGVGLDAEMGAGEMLTEIIVESAKKHGKPAVVIVDEYDKPFLDFYNKPPMAEEVRDIMRGCYSQLKANEPHMRFLFMTGISKFTKAGVFSTLNNLNDLSLDSKFGTLLGYTEKELVGYFAEHLEAGAERLKIPVDDLVDRLRRHYDGFCFDGSQRVYCPFSVLNFFSDYRLLNYWMDSGGTRVIAEYMKGRNLTVEQFRGMSVSMDFVFSPGEIESTPPEGFLYQAGYLTLREGGEDYFHLDYPNAEVLDSMSELVTKNIIQSGGGEFMDFRTPLITALAGGKSKLLIETFNRLLASIPYDHYVGAAKQAVELSDVEITTQEWLYRSTILAFLRGCGVLTFGEMHGNQGRSDLIVTCRSVTWIIEIKIAKNNDCEAQAQEAMKQINDRQYAEPHKNGKKVGIAIDDNTRQIGGWVEA
ncbi:MAG: ATP-binding protein, partial [Chitinispirillales bacterium]|nr:ATP-binding protein [Chitinispirillales bacterium]